MAIIENQEDSGSGLALRTITPNLPPKVMSKLNAYIEVCAAQDPARLPEALRQLNTLWEDENWSLQLRAVALLLADLLDQGWAVMLEGTSISLQPPGLRLVGESSGDSKARLRKALQTGRDRQLGDAGVRKFLDRMHRTVPRVGRRTSIADVIDNGAALAASLQPFTGLPASEAGDRLKSVIDPVIEVCDEDAKCAASGLRLIDIWRYFRHTWSLEYRSTPGRQLAILVRNAARPNRPVMGIGMLASPVVRMRIRDDWIGWNPGVFLERIKSGQWDGEVCLRALVSRLERSIAEIRTDDLVTPDEIAFPSERTILRLEQRSAGAAAARIRELEEAYSLAEDANESVRSQRDLKTSELDKVDWMAASEDSLFVRKRAETLAALLDAKRTFQAMPWTLDSRAMIDVLIGHPNGLRTINVALGEIRKAGLSSQVADVSVCGAVAPYNDLLGGKLVALLMASEEVREAYRSRYSNQISIISSQMAGRRVYRPAELKVLTTTSLYGNGSSQYNRLKIRADEFPQLDHDVEWTDLSKKAKEKTAGYGTVHLGPTTVRVLREVSERLHKARRINNRFGEGSSPRLRQIREAVEALGIDSNDVLHHATPRLVYASELHPGALKELMGLNPVTVNKGHSTALIASLWRRRWLAGRIKNEEVLASVAQERPQNVVDFFASMTADNSPEEAEQPDLFNALAQNRQ